MICFAVVYNDKDNLASSMKIKVTKNGKSCLQVFNIWPWVFIWTNSQRLHLNVLDVSAYHIRAVKLECGRSSVVVSIFVTRFHFPQFCVNLRISFTVDILLRFRRFLFCSALAPFMKVAFHSPPPINPGGYRNKHCFSIPRNSPSQRGHMLLMTKKTKYPLELN
jgi:hypothetical protein